MFSVENVDELLLLLLLPLDEVDDAVETHARQSIEGVLDHQSRVAIEIATRKTHPIFLALPILVSNIMLLYFSYAILSFSVSLMKSISTH